MDCCGGDTDDGAKPQRLVVVDGYDADAVAAEQREADLAEVEQAGAAEVQVQADGQQRVEDRRRADELRERDGRGSDEVHVSRSCS